jgi:aryl-alcohol dehydrogenase-like predicted oxidoreductase
MEKTQLKTAQLGTTGLEITRLGLGAWAIGGGGYDWGWGTQEDDDSVAAIHRAVELGVNWIDTAAHYGFGHSEEVVGRALREGIGVIVYSPMGSGLLTGALTRERIASLPEDDWRKHDPRFQEPQLSERLALVERLEAVAQRHGVATGAAAVAWTLRNRAVDGAIVGFRRPDQVDPIVDAASLRLDDDIAMIEGRT